ncbi:hypothetical protein [Agromyces binzhouensis]|uniref:VIT family protein n=1 Tax=Agromyces binzhouensis TaxID=1817495 RepID=A0A4Q2JJJ3_9MICO|nr:hypothetical protein [Agromyces binzhouensis]RXZ48255.1 hypothetical protein ESO86_07430 [Agromyces binzhouensis]
MDEPDPAGTTDRAAPRGLRRRRRGPDDPPIEEMAEALKERVYATFTGLAIVLVQHENADHISAGRATLTLLVGIVAITAAGFVADVVSHLVVHADFPRGRELARMGRVAGSALGSASIPLILLVLAVLGVFELQGALTAASIVYIVTLALIGYVAVRRTRLTWWEQLIGLGMLALLGLAVVGLQQLAHGH